MMQDNILWFFPLFLHEEQLAMEYLIECIVTHYQAKRYVVVVG